MLGVDFGSSNTAAAFRDSRGGIHQISLSHNGWLMPSAVLYTPDRTLVGRTAVQAALTDPDGFEPSPKRRLAEREIHLGPGIVAVTDLMAAVLREVLVKAQREMGTTPDRVVLTHPDKWAVPMQELLREAAVTAGIDGSQIRLISEASAAAWFYTVTERSMPVGARLAVFDFGAGTCDVAVLDKQPDQTFSVIASDGVEGLGGHDLDARIHAWVRRQLAETNPQLADELAQPGAIGSRLTLNDRIREAKEALSEASQATIAVANGTRTQLLTLTRDEFDHLISPDLDRAVELTKDVLATAQRIRPVERPPTIYLTGGSSAIPAVHARLARLGTLGILGDPKTVVSQGALHAMASMWDVEQQTVNFAKPKDLPKIGNSAPRIPSQPDLPSQATEPAATPEIPWYLQKPERPQQPQQPPTPQQPPPTPARQPHVPQRPPTPPQPPSRPQLPTYQPSTPNQPVSYVSRDQRPPPSVPNRLTQGPAMPPPAPSNRTPWIIAAAIIGVTLVVVLILILMATSGSSGSTSSRSSSASTTAEADPTSEEQTDTAAAATVSDACAEFESEKDDAEAAVVTYIDTFETPNLSETDLQQSETETSAALNTAADAVDDESDNGLPVDVETAFVAWSDNTRNLAVAITDRVSNDIYNAKVDLWQDSGDTALAACDDAS